MTTSVSTTRSIAEAHSRLHAHSEIQFDLPKAQPPEIPEWVKWLGRALEGLSPIAPYVFWGLVFAGGALIAYMVVRWGRGLHRQRTVHAQSTDEVALFRPEEKVARALLAEAEAMAAAGDFAAAVRLLLHRSLEDISRRRPKFLRPALTSREIARAQDLPPLVRETFAAIAAPVERSLFAGRSVEGKGWEAARDAYRRFALPEAWK